MKVFRFTTSTLMDMFSAFFHSLPGLLVMVALVVLLVLYLIYTIWQWHREKF